MSSLKARVHNGRLLLDEATDLPDGEVVYLQPVGGVAVAEGQDEFDEAAEPDDPGHDAAWGGVIERRLQDALDGRVEPVDAKTATARVREAIERRR